MAMVELSRPRDTTGLREESLAAALVLLRRVERDDWMGWDPFDALASPVLRWAARGPFARRAVIQLGKRSVVNLRPLLAVPRLKHTKALGLLLATYVRIADIDPLASSAAQRLFADLESRAIRVGAGVAWGYDFDVVNRWGSYAAREPNVIASAFVAHALADFGQRFDDARATALSRSAAAFFCESLSRTAARKSYFGYTRASSVPIHNANLLAAGLIARVMPDDAPEHGIARLAAEYSVERQDDDGCWAYGDAPGLEWVDGIHTGYALSGLHWCAKRYGSFDGALERGARAYRERLLDSDGAARFSIQSRFPLESHSGATAISTFTLLGGAQNLACRERVARWLLARMRRSDGRFYFRRGRLLANRTPYLRWTDAHVADALTRLAVEAAHA